MSDDESSKDTNGDETGTEHEYFDGVEEAAAQPIGKNSAPKGRSDDQPNDVLGELAEGESLTELVTTAIQEWREVNEQRRLERQDKHEFHQSVIKYGVVAFILVIFVAGSLTYAERLPGSTFAFILGTLFGSLATFLQTFFENQEE